MKKTESVMPVGGKRDIAEILEKLKDDIGVGHVRYSTAGSFARENAQPLVLNYVKGTPELFFRRPSIQGSLLTDRYVAA